MLYPSFLFKQPPYLFEHLSRRELRFHQEVVRAKFFAVFNLVLLSEIRKYDDRYVLPALVRLDRFQDVESVYPRQDAIEQYEVGDFFFEQCKRLLAVSCDRDLVPLLLQTHKRNRRKERVVLNDKYLHAKIGRAPRRERV